MYYTSLLWKLGKQLGFRNLHEKLEKLEKFITLSLRTTVLFSVTISSVEPVNCWPSEFWLKFSYCWFELPSVLFIICAFFSSWFYYFPLFLDDRNSEDSIINKLSKDMGIQINLIDEPSESKLPEHSIYIRTVTS